MSVCGSSTGHRKECRKLSLTEELYVVDVILRNPSMYLSEVCQLLVDEFGISVSPPTICCLLKSYGITHKKIQQVALQRCYSLRGAFLAQCFFSIQTS